MAPPGSRPPALGLVGGGGLLPGMMAREARSAGWRVVAFALTDPETLAPAADRILPLRLDDLGPALAALHAESIRHVVLSGRFAKSHLFHGMRLDGTARSLVERAPDWTDEGLLRTATEALEAMGVELLDQRRFLAPWLASAGRLAGPTADGDTLADALMGMARARELARLGVGQTVVIKAGVVVAVEALEGTDETIARGLRLAGPGATVVKAPAPDHDYRFDVPAVGPETVARCVAGRARMLAVESGRVLLLEPALVAAAADQAGLSVIGVGQSGDSA